MFFLLFSYFFLHNQNTNEKCILSYILISHNKKFTLSFNELSFEDLNFKTVSVQQCQTSQESLANIRILVFLCGTTHGSKRLGKKVWGPFYTKNGLRLLLGIYECPLGSPIPPFTENIYM
jgi:hypothetical protein